jgi:DNA-binding SARP family transcriptional activator
VGLLRVHVLGPFEIEGLDVAELRSRKARSLLKVLALARGRAVPVDRLVDALWGDAAPAQPERELSVNASRARRLVGADRLLRDDAGYRLMVDWLDLVAVEELATEARRRHSAADAGAASAAAAGLSLARGPLLADEPDAVWADADRLATERLLIDLRFIAAESALTDGNPGEAVALAETALEHDPYDEAALRVLMAAHVAAGRPASALAAYATVRARLADDLGASPTDETESLHDAVLRDQPLPGFTIDRPVGSVVAARTPRLIGRERELTALDDALAVAADQLRILLVDGEAGMGKTALLHEWASQLRGRGVAVLEAQCDELGRSLPLQPVADALTSHLSEQGRVAASEFLATDEALLAPLLGLAAPDDEPGPASGPMTQAPAADLLQSALFAALLRVLGRVASEGPAVLLLDDLHLAARSTMEWLRFAHRRGPDVPLLIVGATRTGEGPEVPSDVRLPVGPLDRTAALLIAGPERADDVLARSGGNALYLVELAASPGTELPDSVRDAVTVRCDALGAAAPTIRTAAILGPEIDIEVLAAVLGRPALEVLTALEQGVQRQLLEERSGAFAFRHALVREALVTDSLAARRRLLHGEAARVLESRPGTDPLELAHHAREGGNVVLASTALVAASALAAGRFDLDEATRLLEEAIGCHDSAEARVSRGRIRLARGDYDGADADGLIALELGGGAQALLLRAWVARMAHRMEAAIDLGEQALALDSDDGTRADCHVIVGWARRSLGQLPEAERDLEAAVQLDDDPVRSAWLGLLRVHQGRGDDALALIEPALDHGIGVAYGFQAEQALQSAAHALAIVGRPADALVMARRLGEEIVRRRSEWRYEGLAANYEAWILRNLHQPGADDLNAIAAAEDALPEVKVQGTIDLATGRIDAGDFDEAVALLDRADELARTMQFNNRWRCDQRSAFQRSRLLLATDDVDASLEWATTLADDAGARGDQRYATIGRVQLARALARAGEQVDLDQLERDLDQLARVAGLEAWWLTADAAKDVGEDRFEALAADRARALASAAGDLKESFENAAERYLSR